MMVDIYIRFMGDESVGIFPHCWTIEEVPMEPDEREQLRSATKEYFENYIADKRCVVMFSDEISLKPL
jgi:hypothetical protein